MNINLAIIFAFVVPNGQGKHIELFSNEEFQDNIARRAGGEDNSNEDIGNRDDKSYIPDIDLTLTDDVLRRYTVVRPEYSADNAYFNDTILPLYKGSVTIEDYIKNATQKRKVSQDKNTSNSYFSDITLAETSVMLSTAGIKNDRKSTTNIKPQAPEYYSGTRVPENDSTVNNVKSISKAVESYAHDSSDGALTDGSTTDSVLDTTTNKNADVFTTHDSQIFIAMIQNTGEVSTSTTEDYSAVIKHNLRSEHLEATPFIPAVTPANKDEKNTKKPIEISNTVIHAVNEIEHSSKSEQCTYCYRVYELLFPPKRRNQPFLRNQESTNDQPFYNLKNRLNEVEEKSVELDKRKLRERNNDIDDTAKAREFLKEFNNESRKFVVFKQKNKIPNTSDKIQYQRQGRNREKAKVKKRVRLFDDTNIDILPELMHAILGAKSTNVTSIDSYKGLVDIDKYARLDNLFDLISVTDDMALFQHSMIRKMSNDESKINIHLNILKDLILEDSKALKQYDWLSTTVQIQSALTKILKLIKCTRKSEPIHPADLQILKYIVFLHNFSLGVKEDNKLDYKLRKRMKLLPRNKKKRKNKLLKGKHLINRVWLYLRTLLLDLVEEDEFSSLYKFLIDVQDGLFDLHEAMRHIADVTKFDRQDWYGNLKQLYLSADEKHLRELLLHISMSRLFDLIELSCKLGLDNDIIQFLHTHEKEAKRIVEEMLFITKIIDEIEINTIMK